MIKAVIFDLDGVLADSRALHYYALNRALGEFGSEYQIQKDEHLSTFDGLSTTKKLNLLTELKGLPKEWHPAIWESKQLHTQKLIYEQIFPDQEKEILFSALRANRLKIAVASNSIRENIRLILHRLGILHLVDHYFSNEDVNRTKPSGEIYLRTMIALGVDAKETLIVEDSHIGRLAAINSGANLMAVKSPNDVTWERVWEHISNLNNTDRIKPPKWQGGKMNVLIPMAGAGSRFAAAGYTFPKPLIEVNGKPMIQVVVENLNIDARHVFIVQKEHYEKYNLKQLLNLIAPGCEIVQVDGLTEGAACTTLLAKEF